MKTTQIIFIFAVASILYASIDAWTNVKIIKYHKAKRKQGAAAMMVVAWSLITMFAFYPSYIDPMEWKTFLLPTLFFSIPFIIRYAIFDMILNRLMGWKWNFTGTTSSIDKMKIPFYVRFILLGALIAALFLFSGCSDQSKLKTTLFDTPETKQIAILPGSEFVFLFRVPANDPEGDQLSFKITQQTVRGMFSIDGNGDFFIGKNMLNQLQRYAGQTLQAVVAVSDGKNTTTATMSFVVEKAINGKHYLKRNIA